MRNIDYIFQDWKVNKKNFKGQHILVMYRTAQIINRSRLTKILFFWFLVIYKIWVEWILNCELSWHVKSGKNLQLHHAHSLVINRKVEFGENCIIRHSTTISTKNGNNKDIPPMIGNNVSISPHTMLIGNIKIGDNSIIGGGSIVIADVEPYTIVAGNPARFIKKIKVA